MTATAKLTEKEVEALRLIGRSKLVRYTDLSTGLGLSDQEALVLAGGLLKSGLVEYTLTTGYTLTAAGVSLSEGIVESTPVANRSVGARLPVPVSAAGQVAASGQNLKKLKDRLRSRERTRDQLRKLAREESVAPVRRSLRSLG